MLEFLRRQLALLVEQRAALVANVDAALTPARSEKRDALTSDEQSAFDAAKSALVAHDARTDEIRGQLTEAEETERRAAAAAGAVAQHGETGEARSGYDGQMRAKDPEVYRKGGQASYMRDLGYRAMDPLGSQDATDRLVRSSKAIADEKRALGNTNTTGGSGGEFAPPTWLVNEWINLLRPGRVTADLYKKSPVPAGTSSISIPKVLTGTAVALQSTQNTALAQTDLTTGFVSTGFATIGGKEIVSQQLLDQTAINFDDVISADLAAAYNTYFGQQVIFGAGTGANNNAVLNGLTNATVPAGLQFTLAASPTAATFYSKANGMLSAFVTARYDQPELWLMHPRRWYWLMSQFDSAGRPLVVPNAVAMNPIATNSNVAVNGSVGSFLGLPVVIDPNLPTTISTNQDEVFLMKASDLWLFESEPRAEAFREPYAESLGVLFRLYNYAGTILNRQTTSIATMTGAGLAAPTF